LETDFVNSSKTSQGATCRLKWAAFLVPGKIPEKWRTIWHFSHPLSPLCRPLLSRWARASLEGYGNDNPGAKSQGMKQLMAGGGIILLGTTLIPLLSGLF